MLYISVSFTSKVGKIKKKTDVCRSIIFGCQDGWYGRYLHMRTAALCPFTSRFQVPQVEIGALILLHHNATAPISGPEW